MAVHESQSLFYENRLARSGALAQRWYPRFREALGRDVWGSAQAFWRDLNPIRAGLTRVEADEVSYGLHVLLRYRLHPEQVVRKHDALKRQTARRIHTGLLADLGIAPSAEEAESRSSRMSSCSPAAPNRPDRSM